MMRVLIADDHEVVRRGAKQIIADEFEGAEFGEARNTQEAVECVMRQHWDLVILDINMPGRNGLEVIAEVRRLRPQTPVLVLSGYGEEEFALRSFHLGAMGYLTKSSAGEELLLAVRKVLSGSKYVTAALAERLVASLQESSQPAHESLSSREMQVLQLVASGKTIKEISGALNLSEKTVHTYRARVSQKLNLSTNVELARYALQNRLVD